MIKEQTKTVDCCNACGQKRYNIKREAGAITICMGICQLCNGKGLIIPASDWAYMCGETNELD